MSGLRDMGLGLGVNRGGGVERFGSWERLERAAEDKWGGGRSLSRCSHSRRVALRPPPGPCPMGAAVLCERERRSRMEVGLNLVAWGDSGQEGDGPHRRGAVQRG